MQLPVGRAHERPMRALSQFATVILALTVLPGCPSTTGVGDASDSAFDASADRVIPTDAIDAIDIPASDASDAVVSDTPRDGSIDAPGDATNDATSDGAGDAARDVPLADGGAARVTIAMFGAFGNCMPIVPPDPINVSWTLSVSGAAGLTLTVTDATLTIRGSRTVTQTLTVMPPSFALTGGAGSAMQRKLTGTPTPMNVCGELCGGATATLDLTVTDGVGSYRVSAMSPFMCAL